MKKQKIVIYGKHAVIEALRTRPEALQKVFLSPSLKDAHLRDHLQREGVDIERLEQKHINMLEKRATHQGVIAYVDPSKLVVPLKQFLKETKVTKDTMLVLLAEIQDPHNVGAIIRSSAAFNASGVLMPERNQAPISGAVIKVSAGMAFRMPLVQIGNINQAVRDLKDAGFTIYGLAGEKGAEDISKIEFTEPTVFIVGNEGSGIKQKTREYCDSVVAIPMNPRCESLNAAVSASVALYAWSVR